MLNTIFDRAAAASDHEQGELTVCLGDTARKLATAVVECVGHELLWYVAKLLSRAAALVTGSSAVPDADGWSHLRRLAVVFDGLLEVLLKGTPMEVRP
ncbi:hypothetical protein [Streptomyces sp. NPDC046887]|uniref:hypothetical protein n=1 Tax=Streptomyces sp. NPDC046887 TaxID=3155472 RepID=UPI0034086B14